MSESGPKNPWPSQRGKNPYDPCVEPISHIFLQPPRCWKFFARGIATPKSTYRKTSEGADLKSKEPRLRDWNKNRFHCTPLLASVLKSKEPRLRDWNGKSRHVCGKCNCYRLEIKRTSITRLKQTTPVWMPQHLFSLKSKEPRLRDWNYAASISTRNPVSVILEIKRTSITRLKRVTKSLLSVPAFTLKSKEPRLRDWNRDVWSGITGFFAAWNQKNLDYEIETCNAPESTR